MNNKLKVVLIDHTIDAVDKLMLVSKKHIGISADILANIKRMEEESKIDELCNISLCALEFVNYTFTVENVSHKFVNEFIPIHPGCYVQQNIAEVEGYHVPEGVAEDPGSHEEYDLTMEYIQNGYDALLSMGCDPSEAGGVLPMGSHTNICAQFNLRTLSEMARDAINSNGELRNVLDSMMDCVLAIHPWAEMFLFRKNQFGNIERLINLVEDLQGDLYPHVDLRNGKFIDNCKEELNKLKDHK